MQDCRMAENQVKSDLLKQDSSIHEYVENGSAVKETTLGVIPDQSEECMSSDMLGEWNSEDVADGTVVENTDSIINAQEMPPNTSTNMNDTMETELININHQNSIGSHGNALCNLENTEDVEKEVCSEHTVNNVEICVDTTKRNNIQSDPVNSNECQVQKDEDQELEPESKEETYNNPNHPVNDVQNADEVDLSADENKKDIAEISFNEKVHVSAEERDGVTLLKPSDNDVLREQPLTTANSNNTLISCQEHLQICNESEKLFIISKAEPEVAPTKLTVPETMDKKDFETENVKQESCLNEVIDSVINTQSTSVTQNLSPKSNETEQSTEPVQSVQIQQVPVAETENVKEERVSESVALHVQTQSELRSPDLASNSNNLLETKQNIESTEIPIENGEHLTTKEGVDKVTGSDQKSPSEPKVQSVSAKQESQMTEVKATPSPPTQSAVSKKGFAQLEQMSHEDLLKQCKRQLLFLQKTKMKTDDLSRNLQELQNENKLLKEGTSKSGVSGELLRRLQSENDRLLDEKESQAEVVTQLGKDISKLVSDLTSCKEQMEEGKTKCNQLKDMLSTCESEKKRQEGLILDLQSQIIVLRSERDSDTKKTGEMRSEAKLWEGKYLSMEVELKNKSQEILDLNISLDRLKQELEQGKVLSLEIGDYERSLSDLHAQVDQKGKSVEELNLHLQKKQQEEEALRQQIEHLEQQCLSEESRSTHLKETLESTRQQLASKCEEQNQLTDALKELKQQKEDVLASKEELQYQLSVSAGRLTVLESELKQSRDQSEKLDLSLKSHISSLTEELTETRQDLEASRKEFHNYKVRVHSVLKQQKSSGPSSGQPVTSLSALEEDQKEQMEWTLELCKGKITQMTDQIGALTLERDSLQKEQEWLISKHNLQTQQMQDKENLLIERVEELKQQLGLSHSLWDTEKKQLLQQQQNLTHEYEHRLCLLESEHEKHVSALVSQLDQAQRRLAVCSPPVDQILNPQTSFFDLLPASQLSPSVDESFDICNQERQEGEGSECTDTLPAPAAFQTLVTSPTSGLMPLERLLQAESNTSLCSQDPEMIAINMNTLQKKVDHISELLNESEASNLRLSEQTRLLKEEIRRLERNTERQKHSENLEYLKNIVLKFNTLPAGSERERLVPVISTLLKLSPEEQSQMANTATQGVVNGANATAAGGWGNYLHRWSGLA